MKISVKLTVCLLISLLLFVCTAIGEEAQDITALAKYSAVPEIDPANSLCDERHRTVWSSRRGYLEITLPEEEPCHGVFICFGDCEAACEVQIFDGETFVPYRRITDEGIAHRFVDLPGVTFFRIVPVSENSIMKISELRLIGEGSIPSFVQLWEPPLEKADLMVITAHPDDEYIWFGGTIPYYGTERKKAIQIVTMTCMNFIRRSELLDALWTGGIRNYPVIGPFTDDKAQDTVSATNKWGGSARIRGWIVNMIRTFRPDVVLTHAKNGEYGHPAHCVTSRCVQQSFSLAADETYETENGTEVWQIRKGYTHHADGSDPVTIGWDQPLNAFDGRTSFEVASEALLKHRSQHPLSQQMEQKGRYDCRLFDLVYTTVGDDTLKNDLFENIQ